MTTETISSDAAEGAELLATAQQALEDLKAVDPVVLDVRELSAVMDWLVVASGTSSRHVKSLADNVMMKAKEQGVRPLGVEGERVGEWVLVDFGDVVVHVMQPAARSFYDLERLWSVQAAQPGAADAARVLAVGQKMPAWVDQGVAEYARRIPREVSVEWLDIPPAKRGAATPAQYREQEAEAIEARLKDKDYVVALDITGKAVSTELIAERFDQWQMQGEQVSILIGGPDGFTHRFSKAQRSAGLRTDHPAASIGQGDSRRATLSGLVGSGRASLPPG